MKKFIDELSKLLKNEHRELIEVDLLLSKLLFALSQNEFFCRNFLFKGGTCLIKNYFDYYRFSKDIDFTWRNQNVFKNKSANQLRRDLSGLIDKIALIIEEICKKNNLDFVANKSNERYFEFGGGNKMVSFKLYFISEILNIEMYIKIQINFIECLKFKPKLGKLQSIIPENKELKFLYPYEVKEFSKIITFPIYNIREIFCEKVRAILTRMSPKPGDFIDIYIILKKNPIDFKKIRNYIIKKTLFSLNLYEKYKKNLKENKKMIISGDIFEWGEEKKLLLIKIDDTEFYDFIDKFIIFLRDIMEEIYNKMPNLE